MSENEQDAPPVKEKKRRFSRSLLVILLAWLAAVIAIHNWPGLDHATMNVFRVAATLLSLIALTLWFLIASRASLKRRLLAVLFSLAVLFGFFSSVKIISTDGDLIPRVVWRWTPTHDTTLAAANRITPTINVDLTTESPGDFPGFLGPQRSGSIENLSWNPGWQDQPAPRRLWTQPIGAGWSGFSARSGHAITMQQRGENEIVSCHDIQTGEIVWSNSIQARHETIFGGIGPRSTPTISNGRVYCLGATAILRCLDGSSGKVLWEKDLLALTGSTPDQDIKTIAWGRSSSPLVVDELVIIPLGGPPAGPHISLLALDATSGEERWQSGDRQASYASPSLVELGGEEQVVIVSADLVSGHRLEDGKQLWTYSWSGSSSGSASVSQAATLGNNRLLLSKGYGEGAAVIEVRRTAGEGADFEIETIWTSKQVLKTKFTNVAVKDGFAYGLSDGILECVDLSSGIRRWKKGRLGHGQLLRLADVLVVLAEDGMVWQIATNPEKYQVLGRFPAVEGKCWATLCLYDNLLLVRAEEEAACYELPLTRSR
ncbi:MAG: PQQ-binding-like beta-propeller repeat protein [Planctomycetota bacterium]|nr:PQQ-binding-like beta-propeller repeat protein [Planctomycetota bacterium]